MENVKKVSRSPIWFLIQASVLVLVGVICEMQSSDLISQLIFAMYALLQITLAFRAITLANRRVKEKEKDDVIEGFFATQAYLSFMMLGTLFLTFATLIMINKPHGEEWIIWLAGAVAGSVIFFYSASHIHTRYWSFLRFFCAW